jgi:Cd2+/Zn2+-exporting ATPase
MLLLATTCGLSTLGGFLLVRVGFNAELIAACFIVAYLTGGWFATQDLWHALKHRKIDIQFLMVAVALGALFPKGWTEGATLLFLFSLSNALEQFANYGTHKSIESLLKVAPRRALRRENGRWMEASVEHVNPGDELVVKAGELFPVGARNGVALRARAVYSIGDSGRDRRRGTARHLVSRRCRRRKSCGGNSVRIRQNRDVDERRAHRGENPPF